MAKYWHVTPIGAALIITIGMHINIQTAGTCIIGASVSEPHTSELNSGFLSPYICMYICIVRRSISFLCCNLR